MSYADRAVAQLTDVQLLARLMGTTEKIAAGCLMQAGSLRDLCVSEPQELTPGRYGRIQAALELSRRALLAEMRRGSFLASPAAARDFLKAQLRDRPYEVFCCLFLDNRHRLIAFSELFRGTIDGASVHPREVVRDTLKHNAAAVIFAHNHPSGVAEPSQADELVTRRLKDALGLVDVRVLDHLIVGEDRVTSLAERGLL
jgi:DNA repair protein RadC